MAPDSVFHRGEEEVQRRAGGSEIATRIGPRMLQPAIDADFAHFLARLPFVFVASSSAGAAWVSVLFGPPGFARAVAPTRLRIDVVIDSDDPLSVALDARPAAVGLLAIDPMSRGRIRLNGLAQRRGSGLDIDLQEVFGNCPKYIQKRRPVAVIDRVNGAPATRVGARLEDNQRALIAGADTFVLGSRHPERGADASHRGGRPGFIKVCESGTRLTFPDYQGNMMFQTLGNLTVDPAIGLLFIDWEDGRALQISGRATIVWEDERIAQWPKALRLVDVEIQRVIDRAVGLPLRWEDVEPSQVTPPAPGS